MQVLFDLRPASLVQAQNQKVEPLRLLVATFFVAFLLVSMFNIVYLTTHMMSTSQELSALKSEGAALSDQSTNYDIMVADMRSFTERLTNEIGFLNQELPVVEFLSILEGAVPPGVKITNIVVEPGNVRMNGVALVDSGVVDFAERLNRVDSIVKRVSAPITTKTAIGRSVRSNFTITCDIKGISEITPPSAASQSDIQPKSENSPEADVKPAEEGVVVQ